LSSSAKPPHSEIGESIRTCRLEAGLTQEALALAVKINNSEISRLEKGKRNPKWETMKRLADGLGIPCWRMVQIAETLDRERFPNYPARDL
jgi:transcriptional regulator with XRE-family HTH domain